MNNKEKKLANILDKIAHFIIKFYFYFYLLFSLLIIVAYYLNLMSLFKALFIIMFSVYLIEEIYSLQLHRSLVCWMEVSILSFLLFVYTNHIKSSLNICQQHLPYLYP